MGRNYFSKIVIVDIGALLGVQAVKQVPSSIVAEIARRPTEGPVKCTWIASSLKSSLTIRRP